MYIYTANRCRIQSLVIVKDKPSLKMSECGSNWHCVAWQVNTMNSFEWVRFVKNLNRKIIIKEKQLKFVSILTKEE